jgi:small subunit ribosomal protein S15
MLSKVKKQRTIKDSRIHDADTGSSEVQISILTKRIEELTAHLKKHQKDKHSRRGLLQMVANRQTHMNYLQKKSPRRYGSLVKKLNLKKKA